MTWDDIYDLMARLTKDHIEDGEDIRREQALGKNTPDFLRRVERWNETDETLRQNGVIR